jgi:hypothetical protein
LVSLATLGQEVTFIYKISFLYDCVRILYPDIGCNFSFFMFVLVLLPFNSFK